MTQYTRIRAARLVDGISAAPILDGAVLVQDDQIVAVGPADQVTAPSGATVRERHYPGGTLMPGLIDVHAHLTFGTAGRSYETVMSEDSDDLMLVRAVRNCQIHLKAGITTIRDCGARNRTTLSLRDAASAGLFPSPRLLVSGPPITHTKGHFWWCNGEADGIDGVRAQARKLLDCGVDFLKIMASGGGTKGTDQSRASYSVEEIAAAVQEARRDGKLTTAHCLAADGVANAVAAGIDQVEHINFIQPDGSRRFDLAVAERIVEKGVVVSPTIQTGYRQIERLRDKHAKTDAEQATLADLEYKLETKLSFVNRLRELGAKIVMGTDAIATFGDYTVGLELLNRAGLSPMEVLKAATSAAADAIGLGDVVGRLQIGKAADIVVVNGDPTADIRAAGDIALVMRAGEVITR